MELFYYLWPVAWRAVLELYSIMAGEHVWGNAWANKSVCIFTHNEALVPVINKQTSRKPHMMAFLHPLILTCLRYNIHFTARHIPGSLNKFMDTLSRSQVEQFRQLAPWVGGSPVRVPYPCPQPA